ncbi:MAG: hypothetical protein OEU90_03340 [Gammaproteobacteria bacterium]|nr:hypothetical protein [Gammaproteobacteria bacterium]MDH3804487.1 hypothetical protein [Gammaproteobacteria bacterium]
MERLFTTLISSVAMVILVVPMALAQTPDGDTPAEETICNALKDDGVTKGLYGLCVAFCEAQDHAAVTNPITEVGLDALLAAVPSGSILEAYNRKKNRANNPLDIDMPCINVEEPCPCWTAQDLAAALPPVNNIDVDFPHACATGDAGGFDLELIENFENGLFDPPWFQIFTFASGNTRACNLTNFSFPGLPPSISIPIDAEELAACKTSIAAHANIYRMDGVVWDCFPP